LKDFFGNYSLLVCGCSEGIKIGAALLVKFVKGGESGFAEFFSKGGAFFAIRINAGDQIKARMGVQSLCVGGGNGCIIGGEGKVIAHADGAKANNDRCLNAHFQVLPGFGNYTICRLFSNDYKEMKVSRSILVTS